MVLDRRIELEQEVTAWFGTGAADGTGFAVACRVHTAADRFAQHMLHGGKSRHGVQGIAGNHHIGPGVFSVGNGRYNRRKENATQHLCCAAGEKQTDHGGRSAFCCPSQQVRRSVRKRVKDIFPRSALNYKPLSAGLRAYRQGVKATYGRRFPTTLRE